MKSYISFRSPVGLLTLIADNKSLHAVLWEEDDDVRVAVGPTRRDTKSIILSSVASQLSEYFSHRRQVFKVPLAMEGTPFQRSVWKALLTIPYGETRSYAEIARQVGSSHAYRAVGSANHRNPISIIVPCHRVVGANGALTGFAAGVDVKRALLELERSSTSPAVSMN